MNSQAARLTENGTEIVRLFARFTLGASFLSAVADRFGLWGPYGAKNVSWGNFAHFVEYTGAVTSLFPSSLTVSFAWAATGGGPHAHDLRLSDHRVRRRLHALTGQLRTHVGGGTLPASKTPRPTTPSHHACPRVR
jgi:hypothetical protein